MDDVGAGLKAADAGAAAVRTLRETIERPFADACGMPATIYTSPDVLALEQERVFRREWVCVGRTDAVPEPGCVPDLRDRRPTDLRSSGSGRGGTCLLQCLPAPHVAPAGRTWPHLGDHLPVSCMELWAGWCVARRAAHGALDRVPQGRLLPAGTAHGDLAGLDLCHAESRYRSGRRAAVEADRPYQQYQMENYVETFREEHVWDTNWKLLAENFMESYHLPTLHRATVGPASKIGKWNALLASTRSIITGSPRTHRCPSAMRIRTIRAARRLAPDDGVAGDLSDPP